MNLWAVYIQNNFKKSIINGSYKARVGQNSNIPIVLGKQSLSSETAKVKEYLETPRQLLEIPGHACENIFA